MRLLLLSVLVLTVFLTSEISANRYVSMESSRYRPYDKLFKDKPILNFNEKYENIYRSKSVHEIDKNNLTINVCFENVLTIEDPALKGYDSIHKSSRRIAEYEFSIISKYTALKFYLTTRNCHLNIDFNRPLNGKDLGLTNFDVYLRKPHADILIDSGKIKTAASSREISYLKMYMQVLMHGILHGLGIGHKDDYLNSKSSFRSVYDEGHNQLLYKKDVYNLRSIYGARKVKSGTITRKNTSKKPIIKIPKLKKF